MPDHAASARSRRGLLQCVVGQWLAVGGQDLKMMESCVHARVAPDHLFVAGDLKKFYAVSLGVVTCDDGVSIG